MANIFLDPNDTFTLTSSNTDDSVFGRPGGGETVIIQGAPTGTKLDGNIETVQIAATAAGTTLQINATTGQLEIVSGGVVIGTFSSGLNQSVTLKFSDGDVTLTQTGANSFSIADAANPGTTATVDGANPQTGGAVLANNPTLTVTAAAASVNEGDTATFNVATTNVAAGSTVSYVIGGNAANSANQADVTGPLTGTATVGADGKATISVAVTSDNVTEGSETLTLTAVTGQLSSTANTTINDTSLSPAALTTADDTLTGGAGDDAYSGVSSALSSERTLNPGDKIDGGAGNDTLNVDMKGAFTGFSSTGFLKNVENVNLTNTGTIGREFDASGVTGVQTYKLSGNVNLRDLDSVSGVTIENRDQGTVTLNYANDVLKGESDSLALGLNNVGTAAVAASGSTAATPAQYVSINSTGTVSSGTAAIETVAITSSGTNLVNLSNVGTKAVTAAGAGNLDIMQVNSGVKSFDASAATGNVQVDLAAGTVSGVTSVKGGSGNDQFKADNGTLTVNATVEGGAGSDALALTDQASVLQLAMSGVETVGLAGTNNFVFSGVNVTGLEKVSTTAAGGDVSFANLGGADIAFDLNGTSKGKISSDHSGSSTINVTKPAANANNTTAATLNETDLTLSKSAQVALTVGDKMDYKGTIVAGEATAVTAAIKGQTTGAVIKADKAQSVVISEVTGDVSTLKIDAAKATSVQVTNAKKLDLAAAGNESVLTGVETFSSTGAGDITVGDLTGANQVTIENTGKATVGNIGKDTQGFSANVTVNKAGDTKIGNINTDSQAITVSTSSLTGKVEIGNVNAKTSGNVNVVLDTTGDASIGVVTGKDVTLDFGKVLGANTFGVGNAGATDIDVIATGNVSITGSSLDKATRTDISLVGSASSHTVALKSGLVNDTFTVANNTTSNKTITVSGDLGTGDADTINVFGSAGAAEDTISLAAVSGYEVAAFDGGAGKDQLTGGAGKDTFVIDAGDAVAGEKYDGGAGADILNVNANADFTGTATTTITNIETINLASGVELKAAASTLAGQTIAVNGVAGGDVEKLTLSGTDNNDTIDISKLTLTDVLATVNGGKGNDTITGTKSGDVLVGADGDDNINGGGAASGRDVMAGLSGNDTITATAGSVDEIHFRSVDGSDTINSFSFTEDKIHFLDNGNLTGGSVDFAGFADTTAGAAGTDFAAAQETAGLYVEVADAAAFGTAAAVNGAVFVINADNVNGATITTTNAVLNSYVLVDAGTNLEVYFDANWADTAGREKVMTLVGVADTSQVDVTDFGIYTTA